MTNSNELALSRRFLPPLPWLSAFEAVARLGSVTEAARELSLTQGAVSRQVQKLEAQLGVGLFERQKQRMRLTDAGRIYAADVRRGIELIASAGIKLQVNPKGGPLNLAVLPAFGTHWLAPRLPRFLAVGDGVTVNLSTETRPFNFREHPAHAAIHFGTDDWPEVESLCLMREEVIAVVSPDLWDRVHVSRAGDRLDVPLLHLETRPGSWDAWLSNEGIIGSGEGDFRFDQFAAMIQAALAGLGAAVVPKYLVGHELAQGRLKPFGQVTSVGSYFLVWPERNGDYPPLVAFRRWIQEEIADQTAI